ncbi:hypothetical protein LshimejAT787_1205050 [Lyophyllum shimeji]|uniref:Uncharacterized protein n=1 Tax=Lyophyllum shimeji TaxID=47721 RepID=A0A9P3PWS5_LYOSH|nr:hypothetical protein LshimejAT787_1205050 [Lyophyllum shimeji]
MAGIEPPHTVLLENPTWTCDPVFGIVHPSGCATCLHYIRHLATASTSANDPSFQAAIRERDSHPTVRYLNGFVAGGRVQLEEPRKTAVFVTQFRAERDEALELANCRTAELLSAREELYHIREQLRALQTAFDEVVEFATSEKAISGDRMTLLENILLGSSSARQRTATSTFETRSPRILPTPLPTPPASPPHVPLHSSFPLSSPESSPVVAPLPSASSSPYTAFLKSSSVSTLDELDKCSSASPAQGTTDLSQPSFAAMSGTTPASDSPDSVAKLKQLIDDARNGDKPALLRVNQLYMGAHLTPLTDRTSLQCFLIEEWQDVRASITSSTPTSPGAALDEPETPEIFVDASGWGVGFMLNGRWVAWKLKPGWKGEGRDNNWAEMVAVELGLHVAVAAGVHSQTIVMRSDNWGVVRSLLKGKSRHATQREILKKVIAFTQSYNIDLIPVWVPTADNPADQPSRGVFPSEALRFPISIALPSHLEPYVGPAVEVDGL